MAPTLQRSFRRQQCSTPGSFLLWEKLAWTGHTAGRVVQWKSWRRKRPPCIPRRSKSFSSDLPKNSWTQCRDSWLAAVFVIDAFCVPWSTSVHWNSFGGNRNDRVSARSQTATKGPSASNDLSRVVRISVYAWELSDSKASSFGGGSRGSWDLGCSWGCSCRKVENVLDFFLPCLLAVSLSARRLINKWNVNSDRGLWTDVQGLGLPNKRLAWRDR